jgi:hypothetical protein
MEAYSYPAEWLILQEFIGTALPEGLFLLGIDSAE